MCFTQPASAATEDASQFVVIWDNRLITVEDSKFVSDFYDLADCDYGEGIKEILALDEKGTLVRVSAGESERINTDQENPFRYARAPILAGSRVAGWITFTDH